MASGVLLEVSGPDPKGVRAAMVTSSQHAKNGSLVLSSSGTLFRLPDGRAAVLAPPTALYPFLSPDARARLPSLPPSAAETAVVPSAAVSCVFADGSTAALRLLGVGEATFSTRSLRALHRAPSIAGPSGWAVGWKTGGPSPDVDDLALASCVAAFGGKGDADERALERHLEDAAADGRADAHADGDDAAREQTRAGQEASGPPSPPQPPPPSSAARPGHAITIGPCAPFGAAAPRLFGGFLSSGIVSAVIKAPRPPPWQVAAPPAAQAAGPPPAPPPAPAAGPPPAPPPAPAAGPPPAPPPAPAAGPPPVLFLTDAASPPGAEGAPVWLERGREAPPRGRAFLGMLLPPLTAREANAEISLVLPWEQLREAAGRALVEPAPAGGPSGGWVRTGAGAGPAGAGRVAAEAPAAAPAARAPSDPDVPVSCRSAFRSVVAIRAGASWGSGVVVSSAGHVLTAAHVVAGAGGPGAGRGGADGPTGARAHPPIRIMEASPLFEERPGAGGDVLSADAPRVLDPRWMDAVVLHSFAPKCDLAILQPIGIPVRRLPAVLGGRGDEATEGAGTRPAPDAASGGGAAAGGGRGAAEDGGAVGSAARDLPPSSPSPSSSLRSPLPDEPTVLSSFAAPRSPSVRAAPWSGPPPAWHPIELARDDPRPGDAAVVAGFAAVSPGSGTARRPSLTAGVVARVVVAPSGGGGAKAGSAAAAGRGRAEGVRAGETGAQRQWRSESEAQPDLPVAISSASSLASVLSLLSASPAPGAGARVPRAPRSAALLVSTATVHAGASGGALLDAATGRLLGVVTSNARHSVAGIFPRINFSIPAARLAPIADRLERIARGEEPAGKDGLARDGWEALEPLGDDDVACWSVSRPAENAQTPKKAPWSKL